VIALGAKTGIFARHMKSKIMRLLLVLLSLAAVSVKAADEAKAAPAAEAVSVQAALGAIVEKVQAKAQAGPVTEAALADELKALDQLLAAHKTEKTDEVAQVLVLKGVVYLQLIGDFEKAGATFKQLKAEFPESSQAKEVDDVLKAIEIQQAAALAQAALRPGAVFPDFEEKDLAGNPLSVGKFKGSVVLVDFWATWCGPCVEDMPHVIALYNKYNSRGLEIIGVSLDKDEAALKAFIEKNKMTWPQFFDGKFWENKLARQYGVTSIPFTVLINGDGKIVGTNLRGEELTAALAKLLGP
jgi:thiol-disulfide isomerase/thioredoxin